LPKHLRRLNGLGRHADEQVLVVGQRERLDQHADGSGLATTGGPDQASTKSCVEDLEQLDDFVDKLVTTLITSPMYLIDHSILELVVGVKTEDVLRRKEN
jgi:hypothetical protein